MAARGGAAYLCAEVVESAQLDRHQVVVGVAIDALVIRIYADPFRLLVDHEADLLRAARELSVDLAESVMVGDRCSDLGAANAAGLRQAFLMDGTEDEACGGSFVGVKSLGEVERWLVERG